MTVYLSSPYGAEGGDAAGDLLYGVEGVIGSDYRDIIFGNDEANVLRGGGGNDVLGDNLGNDARIRYQRVSALSF